MARRRLRGRGIVDPSPRRSVCPLRIKSTAAHKVARLPTGTLSPVSGISCWKPKNSYRLNACESVSVGGTTYWQPVRTRRVSLHRVDHRWNLRRHPVIQSDRNRARYRRTLDLALICSIRHSRDDGTSTRHLSREEAHAALNTPMYGYASSDPCTPDTIVARCSLVQVLDSLSVHSVHSSTDGRRSLLESVRRSASGCSENKTGCGRSNDVSRRCPAGLRYEQFHPIGLSRHVVHAAHPSQPYSAVHS